MLIDLKALSKTESIKLFEIVKRNKVDFFRLGESPE